MVFCFYKHHTRCNMDDVLGLNEFKVVSKREDKHNILVVQTVDKVAERQQILLRLFLCKQSSKILEFEHLKAFL